MEITRSTTLSEAVRTNFHSAYIFEKYGMDFCCRGNRSIEEACKVKGIDYSHILEELRNVSLSGKSEADFNLWNVEELIELIVNKHHSYVLNAIPRILKHFNKVKLAHQADQPYLAEAEKIFIHLTNDIINHLSKEEKSVFPYIKALYRSELEKKSFNYPPFGNINIPVEMLQNEHEAAGSQMEQIRTMMNDFKPPQNTCSTTVLLYKELEEFGADLHWHIHLENNVLFPKAVELENKNIISIKKINHI